MNGHTPETREPTRHRPPPWPRHQPVEFTSEPRILDGRSPSIEWGHLFVAVIVVTFAFAPVIGFLTALAMLTVVCFVAAMFGFGRPALGVLGVTLLCTFDPLIRHFLLTSGGLLRWNTFNYWLLIVMILSTSFIWRVSDPHSKLLKAFLVLLGANLVVSPALTMGIQHVLGIVTLFGLLVYFAQAVDDPDLWYMVAVVNGTAGVAGGLAFLILQDTLPYMNTNAWALFPQTAIFAICLGFREAARHRNGQLILSVLAGANAIWTFLSGSRGGMLVCLIGLLYILWSTRRTSHRIGFAVGSVVIGTIVMSSFSDMQNASLRRITKMLDEQESAASRTSGRSDLATAGVIMFKRSPFGVGTGGFAHAWAELGHVPGMTAFKRGEEFQAHSAWIKVLAENGWPGALVMAAFVVSFAVCGWRLRQDGSAALGLFVTTALTLTFLSTEFQGKSVFLLAAATIAQFHPAEMKRCLRADVERFVGKPRSHLSRALDPQPAGPHSPRPGAMIHPFPHDA